MVGLDMDEIRDGVDSQTTRTRIPGEGIGSRRHRLRRDPRDTGFTMEIAVEDVDGSAVAVDR